MINNWNKVKPACCAKWLVLPTVYSEALSYGEQLDKFCYQLNKLIENNNILPDFIAEMIKEYINSGAIGEVVRDILANYILNVKYPPEGIEPASGDGTKDDTAAIQGCIDYASNHGGVVYLPYGKYLTDSLVMKDNVSLFGFDRYSTKLVLKGGAENSLIMGTTENFSIANLTLDGNSGIQVNNVNVISVIASNVLMTNLIVEDGYTLVEYNGSGGHLQVSDVVFGNAVNRCFYVTGKADVEMVNCIFNYLSSTAGNNVIEINTDKGVYSFKSLAQCNQCCVINGNENTVTALIENSAIPITDNGLQSNICINGVFEKKYYSDNVESNVRGSIKKIVGSNYNMEVGGTVTENYNGAYVKNVGGDVSENYSGNNNITGNNIYKTITSEIINTNDLYLNTTNPLKYSKPIDLYGPFSYVYFKDKDEVNYQVLVNNGDINQFLLTVPKNDVSDFINNLLITNSIVLSPGEYQINSPINIPLDRMIIGNNSTLLCGTTFNGEYAINIGLQQPPIMGNDATFRPYKTGYENLNINCNQMCNGVSIKIRGSEIHYSKITLPKSVGVDIFTYNVTPVISADIYLSYVEVVNKDKGNAEPDETTLFDFGLRTNGSDNYISNFRTFGSRTGIWFSQYSGGTTVSDSHVLGYNSMGPDWYTTVGYNAQNSDSIILNNCYADNFATGAIIKSNSCVSNFFYFCWETTNTFMRTAIKCVNFENTINGIVEFQPALQVVFEPVYTFVFTSEVNTAIPPYAGNYKPEDFVWLMYLRKYNSYLLVPTSNSFVIGGFHNLGLGTVVDFNVTSASLKLEGVTIDNKIVNFGSCNLPGTINVYMKGDIFLLQLVLDTVLLEDMIFYSNHVSTQILVPRECSNTKLDGFTLNQTHRYEISG